MIEIKTIFTIKNKKKPHDTRGRTKKKKVKREKEKKETPQHPKTHIRTLIPASPASARPRASIHIRPSALPARLLTFLPADFPDGRRLCTSAFRRFLFRSSADSRPLKRVWSTGVIIGRNVKDIRT